MSDAPAPTEIRLHPVLDLKAAAPLRDEFLAARGTPVTVDAADVQRLGGLCVQVLLSARATWAADDQPLVLKHPSDDFLEGLTLFGASPFTAAEAGA